MPRMYVNTDEKVIGKYFTLPTWLMYLSMKKRLKESHAWYGKNYSLYQWDKYSTTQNRWLSFSLWLCLACLIILGISLVTLLWK